MKATPGLKEWAADPDFKLVYARAIARFEGIPSREEFELRLEKNKGTVYEPYLKKALAYVKEVREADRHTFNKKFKDVLAKGHKY